MRTPLALAAAIVARLRRLDAARPDPAAPPPPGAAWMTLARTPPMGWNSWNKFGCDVSERLVKEMADAMVSSGLRDAGYQYIVIDDCWQVSRDADGAIVPDPERFPSGMKALADYVHAKGLKFGLYSDAGARTCQGRPGSNGYEVEDARQYAAWGVDYLKYDWCHTEGVDPKIAYPTMRDALRATGRPIVFSMCEWGRSQPWTWARGVAHLWRTTGDIEDCWSCGGSFVRILDRQVGLEKYAGPGGWNDPDMLEVGNGGMTTSEYRAHFSFWSLLAAPLMAGNDLRTMSAETRDILANRDVIAIDQDPLGAQGRRIRDDGAAGGVGEGPRRRGPRRDPVQPWHGGGVDGGVVAGDRAALRRRAPGAGPLGAPRPRADEGALRRHRAAARRGDDSGDAVVSVRLGCEL